MVCGVIGPFVVARQMVFISGGLSHAAFGGLGIAYFLGINPLYGATAFVLLSAGGLGLLKEKTGKSDLFIGILWAIGMAIGIIFIHLTPGYTPDLMTFLFGNILTVPRSDLFIMSVLVLVVLLTVSIFYRGFVSIAFDEEYAMARRLPVRWLDIALLLLIGLSIITLIQVVGIILVIALLTIPVAIAEEFSNAFSNVMIISAALGVFICWTGLFFSYLIAFPSGASIIMVGGMLLGVVKIAKKTAGRY
jgi:zinc transport system permease protein